MNALVVYSATAAACYVLSSIDMTLTRIDINEDWDPRTKWMVKHSRGRRKLALYDSDDSDDSERDEKNASSSESNASRKNREEKHDLMTKLETIQTELANTQTEVGELRGQVSMLFSSLQNKGFNFPPTKSRGSSCS